MTHDSDAETRELKSRLTAEWLEVYKDLVLEDAVMHIFTLGHKAALANAVEGFVSDVIPDVMQQTDVNTIAFYTASADGCATPAKLLIQPEPKQTIEDV